MAKELPYFKFFVSEWSDGDITLEKYNVQGLFANLCSYYWSKKCEVTLTKARKKYQNADKLFDVLINSKIIKIKNDFIVIDFLDEQRIERDCKALISRVNGSKGGRPRNPTKTQKEPTGLISLTQTKGNKKRKEDNKIREEKDKRFSKLLNDYVFCDYQISALEKWDDLLEDEKEIILVHAKDFRLELEKLDKTQFQVELNKYIDEKMFNIPVDKLIKKYKNVKDSGRYIKDDITDFKFDK